MTQDFGDGERITGEIIYDNSNVADYIIGLPADIYVYGTDGELLRHHSGDYDEYGQFKELRQYFDVYNFSSNFLTYDKFGNIKRISDSRGATIAYDYDEEENMFVTEIYSRPTQEIYYKLPTVNRSFDNSAESLGEGVISLSFLSDDEIIVTIRDYDKPGFGLNWWNGDKFYSDMFGFASLFRRQK